MPRCPSTNSYRFRTSKPHCWPRSSRNRDDDSARSCTPIGFRKMETRSRLRSSAMQSRSNGCAFTKTKSGRKSRGGSKASWNSVVGAGSKAIGVIHAEPIFDRGLPDAVIYPDVTSFRQDAPALFARVPVVDVTINGLIDADDPDGDSLYPLSEMRELKRLSAPPPHEFELAGHVAGVAGVHQFAELVEPPRALGPVRGAGRRKRDVDRSLPASDRVGGIRPRGKPPLRERGSTTVVQSGSLPSLRRLGLGGNNWRRPARGSAWLALRDALFDRFGTFNALDTYVWLRRWRCPFQVSKPRCWQRSSHNPTTTPRPRLRRLASGEWRRSAGDVHSRFDQTRRDEPRRTGKPGSRWPCGSVKRDDARPGWLAKLGLGKRVTGFERGMPVRVTFEGASEFFAVARPVVRAAAHQGSSRSARTAAAVWVATE